MSDQQRFDFGYVFGDEAEVVLLAGFPIEGDRIQPRQKIKPRDKRLDVVLVANA